MNEIKEKSVKYGYFTYDVQDLNNAYSQVIESIDPSKTIFVGFPIISQSKMREAGLKIIRDPIKADYVLVDDVRKRFYSHSNGEYSKCGNSEINDLNKVIQYSDKFIFVNSIYKCIYKYEGNHELYKQIDELMKSGSNDNIRMGMEFMSNANWEENIIYLQELLNSHWFNKIRGNSYRSSISFKGFLKSLSFDHERLRLQEASDYKSLCKNQEHHDYVYNKYHEDFKHELEALFEKHKIKLKSIDYDIDYETLVKES